MPNPISTKSQAGVPEADETSDRNIRVVARSELCYHFPQTTQWLFAGFIDADEVRLSSALRKLFCACVLRHV